MDTTLEPTKLAEIYTTICQKLAATFPEAAAVLVRNRLRGFSHTENRHILLVEVIWRKRETQPLVIGPPDGAPTSPDRESLSIGWPDFVELELGQPTRTTAHVVKIADEPQLLTHELAAWESCRPVGMTHDSILMRLRPGPERFDPTKGPVSIVYE